MYIYDKPTDKVFVEETLKSEDYSQKIIRPISKVEQSAGPRFYINTLCLYIYRISSQKGISIISEILAD